MASGLPAMSTECFHFSNRMNYSHHHGLYAKHSTLRARGQFWSKTDRADTVITDIFLRREKNDNTDWADFFASVASHE